MKTKHPTYSPAAQANGNHEAAKPFTPTINLTEALSEWDASGELAPNLVDVLQDTCLYEMECILCKERGLERAEEFFCSPGCFKQPDRMSKVITDANRLFNAVVQKLWDDDPVMGPLRGDSDFYNRPMPPCAGFYDLMSPRDVIRRNEELLGGHWLGMPITIFEVEAAVSLVLEAVNSGTYAELELRLSSDGKATIENCGGRIDSNSAPILRFRSVPYVRRPDSPRLSDEQIGSVIREHIIRNLDQPESIRRQWVSLSAGEEGTSQSVIAG